MSKIRDFFYNCSDILTALIILGLAAFLIWTRVNIIMAYPNSYNGAEAEIEEPLTSDDSQNSDGFISNRDLFTTSDAIDPNDTGSASVSDEAVSDGTHTPVAPPEAPTRITVGIPQNATAEQVGNILYSSGLVSDLNEFLALAETKQVTEFMSGSISIESSSTLEQVLDAISLK